METIGKVSESHTKISQGIAAAWTSSRFPFLIGSYDVDPNLKRSAHTKHWSW